MIRKGDEARHSLMAGINKAAEVLAPTLGPAPRLVVIDDGSDELLILDDGVNIAKHIHSDDPYEMMGIKLMRMVTQEAQKNSGDGTTTSSVVAKHLITGLFTAIEDGEHPVVLAQQLNEAWEDFKTWLSSQSREASTDDLMEVVMSALNYDKESAEAVYEALQSVGHDGVVMVQEHEGELTQTEINDGFTLNKGFISPLLVGSRDGSMNLENPLVLITDHIIETFEEIIPVLQHCQESKRPLLIVSAGYKPNAAQNFILNVVQGKIQGCMINPIATGEERAEIYEDVAITLGATPILAAKGMELTDSYDWNNILGSARFAHIDRNSTVFSDVHGLDEAVAERVAYLDELIKNADHPFYAEKYTMRKNKMLGQIATIRVGGLTDIEVRERHERIDDAINALRSAMKGGIVAGGGMTLWNAPVAFVWLKMAFNQVLEQLVKNRGSEMPSDNKWKYFDGKTGLFHTTDNPLVDAHDVVLNSVKAAVSVAMMVLKTDVILKSESL